MNRLCTGLVLWLSGFSGVALADVAASVQQRLQPTTLSAAEQLTELRWFSQAAQPYRGLTVRVVSERIATHWYESQVLAPLFTELTGIRVIHEITGEDDVVNKLNAQQDTGLQLYDGYISDSDLIGAHFRSGQVLALSDFMAGDGASVTLPTLALDDFIGLPFTTGPDGKLYQLPDQQFANLYWFRHDWFSRPELRKAFRQQYGYNLGVPQNWSAYEDIAEFFTYHVKKIDGVPVYGHMDYGAHDPSLGWRLSDAWLGMAGVGDLGLPNGLPVDDWGIRVEGCHPVGASMARGGALDSPAAVYALERYVFWLKRFAPPQAIDLTFTQAGPVASQGQIAQQIFWYTAFTADYTQPGIEVVDDNGKPLWRVAPSPHGAYWLPGMKSGYQDAGSWTFLTNTPAPRLKAAWLYAQFLVSRSVSLNKTLQGLTPIRRSDIFSAAMTERAESLGGLVEFYRSQAVHAWTPTGTNVPDYAEMASLWWKEAHPAIAGRITAGQAMRNLAQAMDIHLGSLEKSALACAPKLNPVTSAEQWQARPGAPKPALAHEKPQGVTLSYEEAIRAWQ